jgi:hypothetical protein
LHRFGCWPRRSSHGRDQLGYQPCTLAPRPAPKSTATLSDIDLRFFLLFFLRKSRSEVLEKVKRLARDTQETLILFPWPASFANTCCRTQPSPTQPVGYNQSGITITNWSHSLFLPETCEASDLDVEPAWGVAAVYYFARGWH